MSLTASKDQPRASQPLACQRRVKETTAYGNFVEYKLPHVIYAYIYK